MALDGRAPSSHAWSKRCGMACRSPCTSGLRSLPARRQETGCFVLLTNVPTAGEMAHRARDVLQAYKEQHGIGELPAMQPP